MKRFVSTMWVFTLTVGLWSAATAQEININATEEIIVPFVNQPTNLGGGLTRVSSQYMVISNPEIMNFDLSRYGAVEVYSRNGNTWLYDTELGSDNGQLGIFGSAIAVNDHYIVVGEPNYNTEEVGEWTGLVHLFWKENAQWQHRTLPCPSPKANERYGLSVSISKSAPYLIAVGAAGVDNGRVFLFQINETSPTRYQYLKTFEGNETYPGFGTSVSLHPQKPCLAIGATQDGGTEGRVYYYNQITSATPSLMELSCGHATEKYYFGGNVELGQDLLLVCNSYSVVNNSTRAYVYPLWQAEQALGDRQPYSPIVSQCQTVIPKNCLGVEDPALKRFCGAAATLKMRDRTLFAFPATKYSYRDGYINNPVIGSVYLYSATLSIPANNDPESYLLNYQFLKAIEIAQPENLCQLGSVSLDLLDNHLYASGRLYNGVGAGVIAALNIMNQPVTFLFEDSYPAKPEAFVSEKDVTLQALPSNADAYSLALRSGLGTTVLVQPSGSSLSLQRGGVEYSLGLTQAFYLEASLYLDAESLSGPFYLMGNASTPLQVFIDAQRYVNIVMDDANATRFTAKSEQIVKTTRWQNLSVAVDLAYGVIVFSVDKQNTLITRSAQYAMPREFVATSQHQILNNQSGASVRVDLIKFVKDVQYTLTADGTLEPSVVLTSLLEESAPTELQTSDSIVTDTTSLFVPLANSPKDLDPLNSSALKAGIQEIPYATDGVFHGVFRIQCTLVKADFKGDIKVKILLAKPELDSQTLKAIYPTYTRIGEVTLTIDGSEGQQVVTYYWNSRAKPSLHSDWDGTQPYRAAYPVKLKFVIEQPIN